VVVVVVAAVGASIGVVALMAASRVYKGPTTPPT
jgi:hypothetical protein